MNYYNSTFRIKPKPPKPRGRSRLDTPSTPMKRIGRRTKAWESVRRQLKREFEAMGITTCEARFVDCWIDDGLGFMHRFKRRKIEGDEIRVVALGCNSCHDIIEGLSPEGMYQAVTRLIRKRKGI